MHRAHARGAKSLAPAGNGPAAWRQVAGTGGRGRASSCHTASGLWLPVCAATPPLPRACARSPCTSSAPRTGGPQAALVLGFGPGGLGGGGCRVVVAAICVVVVCGAPPGLLLGWAAGALQLPAAAEERIACVFLLQHACQMLTIRACQSGLLVLILLELPRDRSCCLTKQQTSMQKH